jgi:adenylate kinase family enzyme
MVIGVSAGVGKSTFSRKLGEITNIDIFHLDALFWRHGWVEAPLNEFADSQREIVKKDQWIIEGNYSNTYDIRSELADTVIYLELPLYVCLFRVVKRWLKNLGKIRPDMGAGCKEKMDWDFIKFIYTTYYPRKKNMEERFQKWKSHDPNKLIVRLKNKREIQSYLDSSISSN